jgi:hypothetical protein
MKLGIATISLLFIISQIVTVIFAINYKQPKNTNQLFEITEIKENNIIEITFQNVNTHEIYILNYLRKYCKNFESIKLGSKWSLPMLITPDETYLHAANLVCEY